MSGVAIVGENRRVTAVGATGARGPRGTGGARSARVLLAGAASSLLTLVVAAPMAYQAHAARDLGEQHQEPLEDRTTPTVDPTVLGTSSVPSAPSTTTAPTTSTTPAAPTTSTPAAAAPGGGTPTTRPAAGPGAGGPDPSPGPTAEGAAEAPTTPIPWFVAPGPATTVPDAPVTPPTPPATVAPPTSAPTPSSDGLRWSSLAPRPPGNTLQGAHLDLPTFVFVDLPDVVRVSFSLDGVDAADEFELPWELFGGLPLVPALLTAGPHTVQAVVVFADGSTTVRVATFTTGLFG